MSAIGDRESREARNTLFTVLANHRRRYVLYACNQADGETTLSDVAEQVAAWEYGKPIADVTSTERKRIYTSIQQHHLSKLEDAGLLDVDDDRIRTTERARHLDVYLEVVSGENIPWATYYLGLAAVGGGSLALIHLGWVPQAVTTQVAFGLFVAVLAVSALVHVLKSRRMKFDAVDAAPETEE
jgi:DNA-binding transcriptional ArsR family regulator